MFLWMFCPRQGQFVGEYVGDLISEEEAKRRLAEAYRNNVSNFYMMSLDSSRWVVIDWVSYLEDACH